MGHHIWKIILSKSVFTRVTDGRRLLFYSIYVISGVAAVSAIAIRNLFNFERLNRKTGVACLCVTLG